MRSFGFRVSSFKFPSFKFPVSSYECEVSEGAQLWLHRIARPLSCCHPERRRPAFGRRSRGICGSRHRLILRNRHLQPFDDAGQYAMFRIFVRKVHARCCRLGNWIAVGRESFQMEFDGLPHCLSHLLQRRCCRNDPGYVRQEATQVVGADLEDRQEFFLHRQAHILRTYFSTQLV